MNAQAPAVPRHATTTTSLAELALIDIGLAFAFLVLPHAIASDAVVRFDALRDLIDRGHISGMPYSMVGPLLAAPFYYLGRFFFTPAWWCARFNTIVLGVGVFAARGLLGDADERRVWQKCSTLILAASMFPNHVRGFGGEMVTAVFVAVGLLAVRAGYQVGGWSAVLIGVVNTPAALVGLTLVAVATAWETRRWTHLVVMPMGAALIVLESWIRRGSPWVTGYEHNAGAQTIMPYSGLEGFSYPFFLGLLSILVSFGKGLLFFAPGLILWIRRGVPISTRLYSSYRLWMWFLLGLILVYAKWWAWYGGLAWGPRFFLFASIPASLAMAVRLEHARGSSLPMLGALFLALTLSVWVGIDGAVFDQQNLAVCVQDNYKLEFLCWYVPEFSVLWRPFVAGVSTIPADAVVFIVYCGLVYVWLAAPLVRTAIRR